MIVWLVIWSVVTPGMLRRGKLVRSSELRPDKRSTVLSRVYWWCLKSAFRYSVWRGDRVYDIAMSTKVALPAFLASQFLGPFFGIMRDKFWG